MKITIFGATGMVGKQIVKQALLHGYIVRAFGRNVYTAKFPEKENLQLIKGALFDEEQVYHAIHSSDAVVSVIGGAMDGTDNTRSLGMKNIVEQMQKTDTKRIIALGGMGVLNISEDSDHLILEDANYPQEYYPVGQEHLKAYQLLSASGLDWTFVCPAYIIDADVTGSYKTTPYIFPADAQYKINSGDLAMFILNELKKNQFIGKKVGISS